MSDNNTNDITVTEEIRELADFLRVFADANDGGEFEAEHCEKLRKAADALLVLDAAVTTLTKENAEAWEERDLAWGDCARLLAEKKARQTISIPEGEEKSDSDPLTGIQYGDLT
jgi:hypothetical protein